MKPDPTKRFSSRVENYVKYRPSYPHALIDFLRAECGLTSDSVVADIGSGTGKLTELFLKNENVVIGIEPNKEMREAGERLLADCPRFQSVNATAEATTLQDRSVNFITAGQAFHWFDREKARREFRRILKPGGWVALIWNDRKTDASPFLQAYEDLLVTYGTEYQANNHKNVDAAAIEDFFGMGNFKHVAFPNAQIFDFDGLKGRLLSSSYAPEPGHAKHVPMLERLRAIFDQYNDTGKVSLECDTSLFYGRWAAGAS